MAGAWIHIRTRVGVLQAISLSQAIHCFPMSGLARCREISLGGIRISCRVGLSRRIRRLGAGYL